jgi:hypothetical protein
MLNPMKSEPAVSEELRRRVLEAYLPNARYVHRARLTQAGDGTRPQLERPESWLRLDGSCGFQAPCYIAATGHLNAVEANITFNQLLYLLLAEVVRTGALAELRHWTLDDFFKAQLPDVLIADYHARFARPMRSQQYDGWLAIASARPRPSRKMLLLDTRAELHDPDGGRCAIDATIALVHWLPE